MALVEDVGSNGEWFNFKRDGDAMVRVFVAPVGSGERISIIRRHKLHAQKVKGGVVHRDLAGSLAADAEVAALAARQVEHFVVAVPDRDDAAAAYTRLTGGPVERKAEVCIDALWPKQEALRQHVMLAFSGFREFVLAKVNDMREEAEEEDEGKGEA